ncbi:MAG: Hpt domain-containing protein [Oligoflexia bacterium]|nr:Hpt domain-containing protein [Oligoflexia bacterium]
MKRYIENLKIMKKILIAPVLGTLLIFVCWLGGKQGMNNLDYVVKDFYNSRFMSYQQVSFLLIRAISSNANMFKAIQWFSSNYDKKISNELLEETNKDLAAMSVAINKIMANKFTDSETRKALGVVSKELDNYKADVQNISVLLPADPNAAIMFGAGLDTNFEKIKLELEKLIEHERKLAEKNYTFSQTSYQRYQTLTLLILILAIMVLLSVSVLIARIITNPIYNLEKKLEIISKGNLLVNLNLNTNDEIGHLASSANTMMNTIRRMTSDLNVEMRKVSNLLNNMKQAVFTVDRTYKVISPVSDYAKNIFSIDIVDKNIFDFLFAKIDKKSTTFSDLQTAMTVVYDNNSMQWMLMEDNLVSKVVYQAQPNQEERLLNISYNPLINENDLVESIMFVVDDITEITKLEQKIEKEKCENNKRMNILQEISARNSEELKSFFNSIFTMLEKNRDLIHHLGAQKEYIHEIFRNLHTIKGNSRMLALSLLAEKAHLAENVAADLRKSLNDPREVSNEIIQKMQQLNDELTYLAQDYSNYAERLFKIENEYKTKNIINLHRRYLSVENVLSNSEKNLSQLSSALEEDIAKLNDQEITELFTTFCLQIKSADIDAAINSYYQIGTRLKSIYLNSSFFRPYTYNLERWSKIFNEIFAISLHYLNWRSTIENQQENQHDPNAVNSTADLQSIVKHVLLYAKENEFALIEFYLQSIYLELEGKFSLDRLNALFENIWSYLALISSFDSIILLTKESRSKLLNNLNSNASIDGNEFSIRKNICIIVSVLKALDNSGREEFFETYRKICGHKNKGQAYSDFISSANNTFDISKFYSWLISYDFSNQSLSIAEKLNSFTFAVPSLTNYRYQYVIDLIHLLTMLSGDEISLGHCPTKKIEVLDNNLCKLRDFIISKVKETRDAEGLLYLKKLSEKLEDVSLKQSFLSFFQMTRDISARLGKNIDLKIVGADISVDREKLTKINDSLIHLVRNALDHGIERPEERLSLGKSEEGHIKITLLELENNTIQIDLSDDGRGLDAEKIKQKAIEKGIVNQDNLFHYSEKQLYNIIFLPGFSTKDNVDELSGRGVGMNIVKKNIEMMGGELTIQSQAGQGTTFSILIKDLA